MIDQLNEQFGVEGAIVFARGQGDLPVVRLASKSGWRAEAYLFGADVVSWQAPGGDELLWTGLKTPFDGDAPISAGVPIVFPQFMDMGPYEFHGFVRQTEWGIAETGVEENGDARVMFILRDTDETRARWPHAFEFEYEVHVGETLSSEMRVTNTGDEPFTFQAALHSYFPLSDTREAAVEGLGDHDYWLNRDRDTIETQEQEPLRFDAFLSRTYFNAPESVVLRDLKTGRAIRIAQDDLLEVVVWTPWSEEYDFFGLLGEGEHKGVVVIEPSAICRAIHLNPGVSWSGSQTLSVEQL